MDYQQHMPGRSSYDPSRAQRQMHSESSAGGVVLLVIGIAVALVIVIWMASSPTGDVAPTANPEAAAETGSTPAVEEAVPATTE